MKANQPISKKKKIFKSGHRKDRKGRRQNAQSSSHDDSMEFNIEQRIPIWAGYFHGIDKWEDDDQYQSNNSVLADIDEESVNQRFHLIQSLFPQQVLGTSSQTQKNEEQGDENNLVQEPKQS